MTSMERSTLHTGKFLALIKEGRWEYAERVNANGAVIIVAVTAEWKLLLVEQYRIPLHSRTIELPAGIVGDEPGASGETIANAAKRELLEEAGYAAGQIKILTTGPSSAGLASELITLVMAFDLKRVHAGGGIDRENITVHEVPLDSLHDWLRMKEREGLLVEPKVYAGLYFLWRENGR
ncbi:MAG TPA: NUDIX hydrolase [Verrucomicrobiae bacterium]|jgi:ADP-ribose pyrophosphatase